MASVRVEQPPASLAALVRHVGVIGWSGLLTGVVVGGLGSRVFMRIAGATGRPAARGAGTEAGFRVGELTVGGTMALVVFVGIFAGIIGALLYAIFRPWLSWAGRFRGLVFGVVLFAFGSASSDVMNPDNVDFLILGNDLINVVMIVALFLAFGVVIEEIHRALDRRVAPSGDRMRIGLVLFAATGALLSIPLTITTMFGDGCDCGPPIVAAWFTILAGVGTVLWWVSSRRGAARLPAQVLGYAGLIGTTAFGLVRAISDAAEIIG
ncbi:MAG: hypothetical protein WD184_05475 [Acidimicrobiia bacterium]